MGSKKPTRIPTDSDVTLVTGKMVAERTTDGEPCLVVYYGDNLGRLIPLEKSSMVVGRSSRADIQISQKSASREHAQLSRGKAGVSVTDLGSTNGTFVNEQRIQSSTLKDGDLLRVGQTIYKFLSAKNLEAKYHEAIYRLSVVDGLTGVFNKRYFVDTLEKEAHRAKRYGRELSVALLDVDYFKQVNDEFGHVAGDALLRSLAEELKKRLRADDVFARYGGEEFAVLLPETSLSDAQKVCEKLRIATENLKCRYEERLLNVTISIGVAEFKPTENTDVTELLKVADEALYRAKGDGRNRVCAAG